MGNCNYKQAGDIVEDCVNLSYLLFFIYSLLIKE